VVLDNGVASKGRDVRDLIAGVGAELKFQPPYS